MKNNYLPYNIYMTKHIKNSNKNVINIHIHEKEKKKKRKHKKKRVHRDLGGVDSHYPLPISQTYYPSNPTYYPYGRLDNDKSAIKTNILDLIDARLKKFDQSHETSSSNLSNEVKQEHENTFFANDEGDIIPSEGSFLANVHVKRHDGNDHYLFHKVEPTLENQAKAAGIDEVITPVKVVPDEDHKIDTFDNEESPSKALERQFDEAIKNIENGNYDEPKSAKVEKFTEQKAETNPLFNMAGNVIGSVADNYIGLPPGTISTVGGYILGGGSKKKEDAITQYEQKLNEVNYESQIIRKYEKLKESVTKSPNDKVTDDEWRTFKELAGQVGYSLKKSSNKSQRKSKILDKLINMESLVKEYDEKQNQRKKEIEEENKKRRTPAKKANIHQIPQSEPTNFIINEKPVTEQQKSKSYFTTTNLATGLGVGGLATVAGLQYAIGKKENKPSTREAAIRQSQINMQTPIKNTVVDVEKVGSRRVSKKGTPLNQEDQQSFTERMAL